MVSECFKVIIKKFLPEDRVTIINHWEWEIRVNTIDYLFETNEFEYIKNFFREIWQKIKKLGNQ